jgi:hypothetical protein
LVKGNTHAQHSHQNGPADKPAVHGMVIFGHHKIYASHLPLFHAPHDYQIILELELSKEDVQKFIADQQQHPESVTYTIEPEKFILAEMVTKLGSFKANLYRGHFERGGIKIYDSLQVKIASVIYFKKFDPREAHAANSVFLVFGNEQERYAAHQISNKPDFDQIILIKDKQPSGDAEHQCVLVILGDTHEPLGVSGNAVYFKSKNGKEELILLKQIYLEFNDLKE